MALQGTLDTFALPDVLRLLASTSKSGCLHVSGSRGAGAVWFQGGGIVAAQIVSGLATSEPIEVLCDLLRTRDGQFVFDADAVPDEAGEALDVEPLLVEAEQLVAEWTEIEQVVPSMDAWVTLVEELPKAKVSVDAASWRVITAVGAGATVRDIGTWMGIGELAVARGVRDLVKLGLAEISEAPAADEVSPFDRPALLEPEPELEPEAESAPTWDTPAPWAEETQWVEDAGYLSYEPEKRPAPVYEAIADPEPFEPFQPLVFDQPQTLAEALPEIPETADAVLGTQAVAEQHPAFQEPEVVVEEEEPAPVDRSRLLKFLGSVGK